MSLVQARLSPRPRSMISGHVIVPNGVSEGRLEGAVQSEVMFSYGTRQVPIVTRLRK